MTLQRLVLTFTPREGVEIRALYHTKQGPNPGTKARRREASGLARDGLTRALQALQGTRGMSRFSATKSRVF